MKLTKIYGFFVCVLTLIDCSRLDMFRRTRIGALSANVTAKIDSFIASKDTKNLAQYLCSIPKETGHELTEETWKKIVNRALSCSSDVILPSIVISTASLGFSLDYSGRSKIASLASEHFPPMSVFEKVVFTIGSSKIGLRTHEIVVTIHHFISQYADEIQEKFLPSFLLALANLGIDNPGAWETLMARVPVEGLNFHQLTNLTLGIVTAKKFPIAMIERIIETAGGILLEPIKGTIPSPALEDIESVISFTHSLACLEVYRTDLFRHCLNQISLSPTAFGDSDVKKLVKQILLSVWLDPKADEICSSLAPEVWHRLDRLLDWSIPEPLRHHGDIAGEIQQLLEEVLTSFGEEVETPPVGAIPLRTSMDSWSPLIAKSVAIDRFYLSDIPSSNSRLFVHIDDETFPDLTEPIDPYIQLKHMHIRDRCGCKLLWIRPSEWKEMDDEERRQFITLFVS